MMQSELRRIAIVCFEDPRHVTGGVQRRIAAVVDYFARRGVEVVVLTGGDGEREVRGSVTYVPVPTPRVVYPLRTLIFSARASRYLREMGPFDIVETHHDAGAAALLAFPVRRPAGMAIVEVVHGVFRDEYDAIRRYEKPFSRASIAASGLIPLSWVEQMAARRATAVVAVSEYGAQQVARRYGVPRERIHVAPNGIDTDRYTPARTPKVGDEVTVLYVGRWHARKGVQHLMAAFGAAHSRNLRLRLRMVGGGPLEPALREEVQRRGLSDVVRFLGALDDAAVLEEYRRADIVCVPSLQEGQGIVALEAQACGAPVVATRAGGLVEAVQDGYTGTLVPPGDALALAGALLELASDDALRRQYAHSAFVWGRHFSWTRLLTDLELLYLELRHEHKAAVAYGVAR